MAGQAGAGPVGLSSPPLGLRLVTWLFLLSWLVLAAFPLVWIAAMSFKVPFDAFSKNPLDVLLGPQTRSSRGGISALDLLAYAAALGVLLRLLTQPTPPRLGKPGTVALFLVLLLVVLPLALPPIDRALAPVPGAGLLGRPLLGITWEHYRAVWVGSAFYRQFGNSLMVTAGVVTVSLTAGTLAAYALARTRTNLAFWLLIAALVFRALPHSVLVAGYMPVFIDSRRILAPLWDWPATGWFFHLFADAPPTLYGRILPVILVLVAINQPFTIWMLRSFFASIPAELDEAARVDGCTYLGAFRRVIMPVMWPGVITAGLFSFLLAYNDFLVTSLLLDQQARTMVPAISQFLNSENDTTDQIRAIAAAVSITAPLFLLVIAFQRQIVSGLTAGAVKG